MSTALLMGAWLALGVGDGIQLGTYRPVALGFVLVALVAVSVAVARAGRSPLQRPSGRATAGCLAVVCVTYVWSNPPLGGQGDAQARAHAVALLGLVVATGLVAFQRSASQYLAALVGLLVSGVTAGMMLRAEPRPPIDVWYLVTGAARSIVEGRNMYSLSFPGSPGITDTFPYLPGSGVLLSPLAAVGVDVRVGLLAATLTCALLLWRRGGAGPALLLLAAPGGLQLAELSWTEPLLLLLITGALLLTDRGRTGWAVICLAGALATKQYVLVLAPLFALWPAFGVRRAASAVCLAGLASLPWFLAGPRDFIDGVLLIHVHLDPRPDSLSLYSLGLAHGITLPYLLVAVTALAALAAGLLAVRRAPSSCTVALVAAWVLACFHVVNKQTFYNEWWLVLELLPVALALAPEPYLTPREPDSAAVA